MVIEVSAGSGAPAAELPEEPSDGIIRQTIFTAETAPSTRPPPGPIPEDDRPEDATGEIVTRTGQRPTVQLSETEPSILVADLTTDLAAARSAVSAAAEATAAAPPPPTMATPAAERTVAEVSDDAAQAAESFSDLEEDFFRAGHEKVAKPPPEHSESFDDLDEGYQPVGFWDRLLGRKPKR